MLGGCPLVAQTFHGSGDVEVSASDLFRGEWDNCCGAWQRLTSVVSAMTSVLLLVKIEEIIALSFWL